MTQAGLSSFLPQSADLYSLYKIIKPAQLWALHKITLSWIMKYKVGIKIWLPFIVICSKFAKWPLHCLVHSSYLSQSPQPAHRSPKRPKTVLSGGRLREMTWWSQTNFFRDHLYHCYGFYLDRLDTPSSFSLISENQLIFRFWAIFDTKFSRYLQFVGTSSLSSVFVQLNSGNIMKKF